MQADINQTKSRSFNYFLRNFHLSLRILAAIFSTRIIAEYEECPQTFSKYVLPVAIVLAVLNLAFIIYFKCRNIFPRCEFFLFMSINIVLCSVIGLLTYSYINNGTRCKKNLILEKYIVLQVIANLIICVIALLAKFQFAQRYTNSPGNITWTIIILSFAQDMTFTAQIQVVAWVTAFISVSTLVINIVSLITGITPTIKKAILISWISNFVFMVLCILLTLVSFLNNYFLKKYASEILSNVSLKYILVSIIDLGMWIWGLLTLTYENGDLIRNVILYGNYSGYTREEADNQVEHARGKGWMDIKYADQMG